MKQNQINKKDLKKMLIAVSLILAMIMIPSFLKYIKRSKTVEATTDLHKLFDSSVSNYDTDHVNASNNTPEQQSPLAAAPRDTIPLYIPPRR